MLMPRLLDDVTDGLGCGGGRAALDARTRAVSESRLSVAGLGTAARLPSTSAVF
jgi:hypothetical protein